MAASSQRYWLALAGSVVVAAGILYWRSSEHAPETAKSPLALIPPGPAYLLTIDVDRLATEKAGSALLASGARRVALTGGDCATDALLHAKMIVIAAEGPDTANHNSEFAIVASGDYKSSSIVPCVEKALRDRHGSPVRTQLGSFVTVRDQDAPSGEVAVRDGGPLILSNGTYLRDIIDAAGGKARPADEHERNRDALHVELRRTFGEGAPVILTVALAGGWLETWLSEQGARFSPLSELRSVAVRIEPTHGDYLVDALFTHANPEAAKAVEKLVRELETVSKPDLDEALGARVAAQLEPRLDGANLRISAHIVPSDVELWRSHAVGSSDPQKPKPQ